jgi:alpha-N-arabinofuranosidase
MKPPLVLTFIFGALAYSSFSRAAEPAEGHVIIHGRALHDGKIDPKLFGNFIELLDDVVPGMCAEMLNDRSFEGVIRAVDWSYYDGSLDICDREWDANASWSYETNRAFNGARCVRISASSTEPGSLTQSGLAVKKALGYKFSGFFRTENPNLKATALLKVQLPTDEWLTLAAADLGTFSTEWRKQTVSINSIGGSDRVVFELRVTGEGHLWADKLSLMPEDNVSGWREDVIAVTKDVHASIVRWGGSMVDPGDYKWKDGIGDRDLRVPFGNKNWGRIDPNDVGIDEFCQFCELTGTEPLICVSFADGARSAADLVEYCNGSSQTPWGAKRSQNGHPAPYHVKYFQVGNEISGDNPKYLEAIPDFVHQMKQAGPGIAVLSSYPSQKLLDKAGPELDYVAPHHYTPNFQWCDAQFTQLTEIINKTPGCAHLKMAATEWNIDGGGWGLGRGKQMTLSAALLNARYLHVLMRHSDKVEIACRSNMANSYCGAIYETSPGGFGLLKRPSYYIMQLYARHAKVIPLHLEGQAADLDLFACASADKKSITLFAINTQPKPVNCSLEFTDFNGTLLPVRAETVGDVLNAGQPDVMNHWGNPERVKAVAHRPSGNSLELPRLSATAVEFEAQQ